MNTCSKSTKNNTRARCKICSKFTIETLFSSFIFVLSVSIVDYRTQLRSMLPFPTSIRKNIFDCLFRVHNTSSLSHHEQVCLMRLGFEKTLLPSSGNVNDYVGHI